MKRFFSSLLLAALLLAGGAPVLADQSFASFSARAVLPDNQVNSRNSFFDLMLEPGQEQTVELLISNSSSQPMIADVALNAAGTGRGGLIIYTQGGVRDDSAVHFIEEVATLRQSWVEVPAGGEAGVLIDLAMPEEAFDGVLLGGLVVTKRGESESTTQGEQVTLQNELAYIVGLQLRQNTGEVAPELHLRGIDSGIVNYHTAVTFQLQNSEPVVMKGVELEAAVYGAGDQTQPLRTLHKENAEMAPTSTGEFVIDWDNQALQSGSYRLHLIARHQGRVWEWDETFAIGDGAAAEANQQAVGLVQTQGGQRWVTSILMLLVLAVIILTAWRILRDRREHDLKGGAYS